VTCRKPIWRPLMAGWWVDPHLFLCKRCSEYLVEHLLALQKFRLPI
jgi:hypothetical protein